MAVEELREKSLRLGFKVSNKENAELLAFGHLVIVAADKNIARATRIPEEIVVKLKQFSKQVL